MFRRGMEAIGNIFRKPGVVNQTAGNVTEGLNRVVDLGDLGKGNYTFPTRNFDYPVPGTTTGRNVDQVMGDAIGDRVETLKRQGHIASDDFISFNPQAGRIVEEAGTVDGMIGSMQLGARQLNQRNIDNLTMSKYGTGDAKRNIRGARKNLAGDVRNLTDETEGVFLDDLFNRTRLKQTRELAEAGGNRHAIGRIQGHEQDIRGAVRQRDPEAFRRALDALEQDEVFNRGVAMTGGMKRWDWTYANKVPQIAGGVGISGFAVQSMSNRRGQKRNPELYSQNIHGGM